jgi:serine/threonine protein kinase
MSGTPAYQAPELLLTNYHDMGYTAAVDSWALGCCLYILFCGNFPFAEDKDGNAQKQFQSVTEMAVPSFGDGPWLSTDGTSKRRKSFGKRN